MSTFIPMENSGTFVRADKSQAKGTKFLFVYNKTDKHNSLQKVLRTAPLHKQPL